MTMLEHVRFTGRKSPVSLPSAPPHSFRPLERRKAKRSAPPLTPAEQRLVAGILRSFHVDPECYRTAPLQRRIRAILRALRCCSAEQALEMVAASEAHARRAIDALIIGHTAPFRDLEVFHALRNEVLPRLPDRPLSAWSVGCSRGMELLSVALLLAERGQLRAELLRGSDCRDYQPAADPRLPAELLASIPADFDHLRGMLSEADLRALIHNIDWRREDVVSLGCGRRWDLVLCRNLSIYLNPAAAARLWKKTVDALVPGGILVTGKAERPHDTAHLRRLARCIYQRRP